MLTACSVSRPPSFQVASKSSEWLANHPRVSRLVLEKTSTTKTSFADHLTDLIHSKKVTKVNHSLSPTLLSTHEIVKSDSSWPCFSSSNQGRPFGLAVFEDRLWISDQEQQQLRSVHKRTGKTLQLIRGNMVQPASIAVLHPLAKPGTCERWRGEVLPLKQLTSNSARPKTLSAARLLISGKCRSRCVSPLERRLCSRLCEQTGTRPLLLPAASCPVSWRSVLLASRWWQQNDRWFIFAGTIKRESSRTLVRVDVCQNLK